MIALVGLRIYRSHFSVKEKDEASLASRFSPGFVECLHSPFCRSLKVFLFSDFALVSHPKPFRGFDARNNDDRSAMQKIRSLALAALCLVAVARAATFTEDFSNNPSKGGWRTFGNANLFRWDSEHQNLAVTWDSSQPNSYFYYPLGAILSRDDDFSVSFNLRLNDVAAGIDPQMPSTFPLAIGFLNLEEASQPGFFRGTGYSAQDLVEFSFFPDPGGAWIYGPSLTATMIDSTGFHYASGGYDPDALATNDVYRVNLTYTASSSNLVMTLTRNNALFVSNAVAHLDTSFTDFRVDAISISSYSQAGQDTNSHSGVIYAGSLLAHGTVDDLIVNLPPPPVQNLSGSFSADRWQVQFMSRSNWLYTLERTADFTSWRPASISVRGNATNLILQETNAPPDKAFYRVRAERP